ncbi:MAG: hypothetical protein QM741_11950 [Rudaea sp.]|uniref:hypothetical protein n=1 Tax=Rudaea sp. TaxID=2136325 RepID=UPI0039E481C1
MRIVSRSIILASALFAFASIAHAQDSSRTYTNAQDREVIVRTGMPAADHYGPKPSFAQLDHDHDGTISREEADAFPPLANDFDFVAQNGNRISARQYAQWDHR